MKYNLDKLDDLYRLKDDILSPFDNLLEDDLDMIFKELCKSYNIKWDILYVDTPFYIYSLIFLRVPFFQKIIILYFLVFMIFPLKVIKY